MITSQSVDDLLITCELDQLRNADVFLTWIGEDFQADYLGFFDPGYIQALRDYVLNLMTSGRAWETKPPQLLTEADRRAALRHER